MMLNQCTKDFQSLIERLQLLRAYEDADENNRSPCITLLDSIANIAIMLSGIRRLFIAWY